MSCHLPLGWADRGTGEEGGLGCQEVPSQPAQEQQPCAPMAALSSLLQELQPPQFPPSTAHWECQTLNLHLWALVAQREAEGGQAPALRVPVLTEAEQGGKEKKSHLFWGAGSSLSLLLVFNWESSKTRDVKFQEDGGWGIRQSAPISGAEDF